MSTSPEDPSSTRTPAPWRRTAQSVLTRLSHGTTPFITTFVLIHLTAPALAALGGTSLSSQVMVSVNYGQMGSARVKCCTARSICESFT